MLRPASRRPELPTTEPGRLARRPTGMRILLLALGIATVAACGSGPGDEGTDSAGSNDVASGTDRAVAQPALGCAAFETSTAGPSRDGIGDATPELAAAGLVTFGRSFDPGAYTVAVSQGGRVTYSDASGAVVAEAVVRPGKQRTWLPVEARVCESVLGRTADAFVDSCVGPGPAELAPELTGLTEDEFSNPPGADTNRRVIGRDGRCLDRPEDQTGTRVDAVVEDGRVVWAGRC